jgi:hypothetical protein
LCSRAAALKFELLAAFWADEALTADWLLSAALVVHEELPGDASFSDASELWLAERCPEPLSRCSRFKSPRISEAC